MQINKWGTGNKARTYLNLETAKGRVKIFSTALPLRAVEV